MDTRGFLIYSAKVLKQGLPVKHTKDSYSSPYYKLCSAIELSNEAFYI